MVADEVVGRETPTLYLHHSNVTDTGHGGQSLYRKMHTFTLQRGVDGVCAGCSCGLEKVEGQAVRLACGGADGLLRL